MGEQVNDVSRERSRKVARVRAQAERVPVLCKYFFFMYLLNLPLGIEKPGFFSSPERFAPAMTPVTPEKTTPKTVKKFTCKGKNDILL